MTLDHPDYHALLAAVLADPADDTPRLVLADWLEENAREVKCFTCGGARVIDSGGTTPWGEPVNLECPNCEGSGRVPNGFAEYGEFIRVQCELAAIGPDWQDAGPDDSAPVDGRFVGGGEFVGETFARPPVGARITGRFVAPKGVRRIPGLRVIRVSDDRGSDGFLVNAKRDEHSGKAYRRVVELRKRERELWNGGVWNWHSAVRDLLPEGVADGVWFSMHRRGFVDEVTLPLRAWVGEPCGTCDVSEGVRRYPTTDGDWIEGTCNACLGLGTVGGIGPELVRRCPLTRVTLSEAEFQPVESLYRRWVFPAPGDDYTPDAVQYVIDRDHSTRQSALGALSDACLAWARSATKTEETTK